MATKFLSTGQNSSQSNATNTSPTRNYVLDFGDGFDQEFDSLD
jgi:hypothetical protein